MSKRFIPPSSGQVLRSIVDAFELRQTDRLKSSTARDYFRGSRVKPETVTAVITDVAQAFFAAGITPPTAPLPPKELLENSGDPEAARWAAMAMITSMLHGCSESWDLLVSEFRDNAPQVIDSSQLGLAFARLAVIDAALRIAAFRSSYRLGPLEAPAEDQHAGYLIRRLMDDAAIKRPQLMRQARVSKKTVDDWCDHGTRMNEENILDTANALSSDATATASRLRRHYAYWAFRSRAVTGFGEAAAIDLFSGLTRVANGVLDGLSRSQLPQVERRKAEVTIIFLGRAYESTRFLRNHVTRTEKDGHWIEALAVDDLDYVVGHARRVAAIPAVRACFEVKGANMEVIDRLLKIAASAPRPGFMLKGDGSGQHLSAIRGDAEMTAHFRDAQAEEALLRGDLESAMAHLRRQVFLEPENAMWHFKLGAVLSRRGDYDEALAECWLAAQIDPRLERPRVEIGVIHLEAGDPERAVAELEVARPLFEAPSADLLYHLGVGYFRLGKLREANEALEAALSVDAEDARTLELAAEMAYRLDETARGWRLAKEAAHRGRPGPLERWHRPKGK